MENPHKRKDVRLVTEENKAIKLTSKPEYQDFRRFHDYLYGITMKKIRVNLDKPVFIGFTVLELSKLLMLEFLYDYFKPLYPDSRVLYTNTDSFILASWQHQQHEATQNVNQSACRNETKRTVPQTHRHVSSTHGTSASFFISWLCPFIFTATEQ
ncbi:hypothetical protein ACOMHN_036390 [Nucella lapillus]